MASKDDFSTIYDEYADSVYRWCRRLGLGQQDAEDAMQEVFMIAFGKLDDTAGYEAPAVWLYQIARRVVANKRRLGWFKRFRATEDMDRAGDDYSGDRERNMAVRHIVRSMTFKLAEVLLLHDLEGYTRDQIAEMTGAKPGTVASRLRLAREDFAKRWEETEK